MCVNHTQQLNQWQRGAPATSARNAIERDQNSFLIKRKAHQFFHVDEMRNDVYLALLAGLYHRWDKDLREWVVRELAHWIVGSGLKILEIYRT